MFFIYFISPFPHYLFNYFFFFLSPHQNCYDSFNYFHISLFPHYLILFPSLTCNNSCTYISIQPCTSQCMKRGPHRLQIPAPTYIYIYIYIYMYIYIVCVLRQYWLMNWYEFRESSFTFQKRISRWCVSSPYAATLAHMQRQFPSPSIETGCRDSLTSGTSLCIRLRFWPSTPFCRHKCRATIVWWQIR